MATLNLWYNINSFWQQKRNEMDGVEQKAGQTTHARIGVCHAVTLSACTRTLRWQIRSSRIRSWNCYFPDQGHDEERIPSQASKQSSVMHRRYITYGSNINETILWIFTAKMRHILPYSIFIFNFANTKSNDTSIRTIHMEFV